jgi:hypothetical protein
METPDAKAFMRRRGQTAEHGFADLKEHRKVRRMTGRGLDRAKAEVGTCVLTHNLLALHKHLSSKAAAMPAGP